MRIKDKIKNEIDVIIEHIGSMKYLILYVFLAALLNPLYKDLNFGFSFMPVFAIIISCGLLYFIYATGKSYDKELNQSSKPNSAINLGIISLLIFFISFFLPFYNLGSNGVTLWYILTEVPNNDLIGIFVLFVGGIMLVANVDMNIIKTATIIGVCFPLYRFYKIVSVGDIGSSYLQPSFGIGGYLILIGAGIQLYACFSSTNEDDVIGKDIAEPQKESNLKDNINTSNTDSTDNENSSGDITEKIEKLSQLKDKGVLTEEEFDDKKKELLDRI